MNLTPEQEDEFLGLVIPCENELEYERALVLFAKKYNRTAGVGIKEGNRYLLRRAIRRSDYQGPHSNRRRKRVGLPYSWTEQRILRWAFDSRYAESVTPPTVEYIANLLQRSVEEIDKERTRRKTTKFGIRGFDL